MNKKNVLTNAGGGGTVEQAFTMAEILLSLAIIGVVAAITLPSLTGNINARTWNTQRKALYARFSQAIALMPALNGYSNAETFVTAGLSKVLKINNICDSDHLIDCGIVDKMRDLKGDVVQENSSIRDTDISDEMVWGWLGLPVYAAGDDGAGLLVTDLIPSKAAFETVNGDSIVLYYYRDCQADMDETSYNALFKICANFIYDLNGSKGPNTMGKDIGFITAIYPIDSIVVAPFPLVSDAGSAKQADAGALCRAKNAESRLPNIYELSALYRNKALLGLNNDRSQYWSSTIKTAAEGWSLDAGGYLNALSKDTRIKVQCIKQ